jgi:antitoxin MazE
MLIRYVYLLFCLSGKTMTSHSVNASIYLWGNGLAVRLNKAIAKVAGVVEGTPVRIVAEPGRIIIETTVRRKSLKEMLRAYSLELHGGELMATSEPVGEEIL